MENTRRPKRASGTVVTREIDDELLILDEANEKVHQLNSTACQLWNACDGHNTVEQLVTQMQELFDVEEQRVRADVEAILTELEGLGLVEYGD